MTSVGDSDGEPLDAYSRVVTAAAQSLLPSIAGVEPHRRASGWRQGGVGSAVVVAPDGYLLTSAHVVGDSRRGRTLLPDGRRVDHECVGSDPLSDLAVLRASVADLAPAPLGDASQLKPGQLVVAIGSPLGFAGSVSAGVVSAVGRSFPTSNGRVSRIIDDVIQTDAALHPGNSGGALANARGEVVGINTAVVGPGIGPGLGLAVPINTTTRQIISALMRTGRVRRAYLGVAGGTRPLPPRAAQAAGRSRGIEVTEVMPNSPAAAAGIRLEDVLVELDGRPVEDVGALQAALNEDRIGGTLELTLVRNGSLRSLTVQPVELEG